LQVWITEGCEFDATLAAGVALKRIYGNVPIDVELGEQALPALSR
jgi:hypothetical protein